MKVCFIFSYYRGWKYLRRFRLNAHWLVRALRTALIEPRIAIAVNDARKHKKRVFIPIFQTSIGTTYYLRLKKELEQKSDD